MSILLVRTYLCLRVKRDMAYVHVLENSLSTTVRLLHVGYILSTSLLNAMAEYRGVCGNECRLVLILSSPDGDT